MEQNFIDDKKTSVWLLQNYFKNGNKADFLNVVSGKAFHAFRK